MGRRLSIGSPLASFVRSAGYRSFSVESLPTMTPRVSAILSELAPRVWGGPSRPQSLLAVTARVFTCREMRDGSLALTIFSIMTGRGRFDAFKESSFLPDCRLFELLGKCPMRVRNRVPEYTVWTSPGIFRQGLTLRPELLSVGSRVALFHE